MSKIALVWGATGLTGSALTDALLESSAYQTVKLFVRKPTNRKHPKLVEVLTDFENLDKIAAEVKGDDLFCCLGTTRAKAGSDAAQQRIDRDYPIAIAKIAAQNGVKIYCMVSSVGTNSTTSNFYLKTKYQAESGIIAAMGAEKTRIFRPSFLLGNRQEVRPMEKMGIVLAKICSPLLAGKLRVYRGIEVSTLSKAMIAACDLKGITPPFHYDEILQLTK